jgi:outer membrane protein
MIKLLMILMTAGSLYSVTLDLDTALKLAIENNQQHKISELEIKKSQSQYAQSQSSKYPQATWRAAATLQDEPIIASVKGNFDLPKNFSDTFALTAAVATDEIQALSSGTNNHTTLISTLNAVQNGTLPKETIPLNMDVHILGRHFYNTQVDIFYPLYTGGKSEAIIKQASLNKMLSFEKLKQTDDEIRFEVKKYFYTIIFLQKLYLLSQDTKEYFSVTEKISKRLIENGSLKINQSDYLKVVASLNMYESMTQDILTQLNNAKYALGNTLGLDENCSIDLIENGDKNVPFLPLDENHIANNIHQHSLLRGMEIVEKIAESKTQEIDSDYYPMVAINGNLKHIDGDESIYVNSQNRNSWTVGIGMEWNLFNGYRTTSQNEEARIDRLILSSKKNLLERGLKFQLKSIINEIKDLHNNEDLLSKASKASTESRNLIIEAYKADLAELKEVLETLILDFYAQSQYEKAKYSINLKYAELEKFQSFSKSE